ncbi:hypothetical protein GCM10027273_44220 [Nocardioides pakistanensis]
MVAGAGFEPATSGRHRGRRGYYCFGPEATDSLGVVRDLPSLPVSEYLLGTERNGPNVDPKRYLLESVTHVHSDPVPQVSPEVVGV